MASFQVVGKLSSGAYGDVLLITIGTTYHALKVCTLARNKKHQLLIFFRDSIREFLFAQCLLHTHLLGYFVNEYVDMSSTAAVRVGVVQSLALSNLFQLGTLSVTQFRTYFFDVVVQVQQLHSQGILHRDIKPENILQLQTGQLLLTDPSLCIRHSSPSNPNVITLWYRPPELLLGEEPCTSASDVWALAITILDTLNKRSLFTKISTETKMIEAIGNLFGCTPTDPTWYQDAVGIQQPQMTIFSVDSTLQNLLQRMLKIRPSERISMADVVQHPFWTENAKVPIVPLGSTIIKCSTTTEYASMATPVRQCKEPMIQNTSSIETRILVLDTFFILATKSNWPLRTVLSAMYLWDIFASAREDLSRKRIILAALLFCAVSIETDEERFDNLKELITKEDIHRFQTAMVLVLSTIGPVLPPIWKYESICTSPIDLVPFALGPNIWTENHQQQDLDDLLTSSCFDATYLKTQCV